jgi:hypothetical protein
VKRSAVTTTIVALLGCAGFAGGPAWSAVPPELESLFPRRAEITVEGSGLARLVLPPEVLATCRADLSDIRIVADGQEVPYLVDSGLPPSIQVRAERRLALEIVGAERQTSERESAPDLLTETYTLAVPETARGGEAWDLVFTASLERFIRQVRVVAAAGDGAERVLVERESIFRLPAPGQERVRVPLPDLASETLVVALSGEEGRFLEPSFSLETSRVLAEAQQTAVELGILERHPQRDGRSRVELARPRGLVPDLLRIATSTPSFSRKVEVWDEGPGADAEPLGVATLFRVETAAGVQSLELPIRPGRGDRLQIVFDDGDSPSLQDLRVEAVVRRPALLFSPPSGVRAAEVELLFGGARAYRPRYDLSNLLPARPARQRGERALVTEQLYDPSALATASLGPLLANPAFDPAPALAFAMEPGAQIDPRRFRHRVALGARDAPEGLFRMRLEPEIATRARRDLGDLRVVDQEDRQVAYLLERDAGQTEIAIELGSPETRNGTSSYPLPLPIEPLVVDQVVLNSDKEFFDRAFELVGRPAGGRRGEVVLARGRLARRPGDPRELRIDCQRERLSSLELRVVDSDDAPLPLRDVSVRTPATDLYFAAPGGDYSLLLGSPDESAPRYELSRVRNVVLAVESSPVDAGGIADNPAFSAGSRLASGSGLQQVLLWAALAVAVIVLAWFTLRLSRAGDG